MNNTTKTILIASSILAIGGIVIWMTRKKGGQPTPLQVPTSDETSVVDTSLKGKDITNGGTRLPSSSELKAWIKANPIKLELPSLKDFLKIGEQVPKTTIPTTSSTSNYGIDQTKLAQWKKQFGV